MQEYKVIHGAPEVFSGVFGLGAKVTFHEFEAKIAEYLKDGWVCQGGVQFVSTGKAELLFQALVR